MLETPINYRFSPIAKQVSVASLLNEQSTWHQKQYINQQLFLNKNVINVTVFYFIYSVQMLKLRSGLLAA